VTVYDINDEILEKAKTTFKKLRETYTIDLSASKEQVEETIERLSFLQIWQQL
jgi:3-hydroxyacyl-CoA dehydrogenase